MCGEGRRLFDALLKALEQSGFGGEAVKLGSELLDVPAIEDEPVDAVAHRLGHPSHVRHEHRYASRHALEHRNVLAVPDRRRQGGRVDLGKQRRQLGRRVRAAAVEYPTLISLLQTCLHLRSDLAMDAYADVRGGALCGLDEQLRPLVCHRRANEANGESLVAGTTGPAFAAHLSPDLIDRRRALCDHVDCVRVVPLGGERPPDCVGDREHRLARRLELSPDLM